MQNRPINTVSRYWLMGKFTGTIHIWWENQRVPVIFPNKQPNDCIYIYIYVYIIITINMIMRMHSNSQHNQKEAIVYLYVFIWRATVIQCNTQRNKVRIRATPSLSTLVKDLAASSRVSWAVCWATPSIDVGPTAGGLGVTEKIWGKKQLPHWRRSDW